MADILMRLASGPLVIQGLPQPSLQAMGHTGSTAQLCIFEPESVGQMHRQYYTAGVSVAISNSAQATSDHLEAAGLLNAVEDINRQAVTLAARAGAPHVLAQLTPCLSQATPCPSPADADSVPAAALDADGAPAAAPDADGAPAAAPDAHVLYAQQAAALATGGPDAFLLRGFTSLQSARIAMSAVRAAAPLPVFVVLDASACELGWETEAVACLVSELQVDGLGCEGLGVEACAASLARLQAACAQCGTTSADGGAVRAPYLIALPDIKIGPEDRMPRLPSAERQRLLDNEACARKAAQAVPVLRAAGAHILGLERGSSPLASALMALALEDCPS